MPAVWALAAAVLEGFAVLPADTFMPGPRAGHAIEPQPGLELPFEGQPVQGFSAIARNGDRDFLLLSDNGFGLRSNSADFVLRIYSVSPDFRTARGGSGKVRINGFINLADPYRRAGFRVTAQRAHYGPADRVPVDASLREHAWLTGADFDPESMAVAPGGDFWVGDEFGPFLLHFDAAGALAETPFAVPGLASPQRPGLAFGKATVGQSRGFEGLARVGETALLLMLEAPLPGQEGLLNIYRFDLASRRFDPASQPVFRYPLDPEATAIGDLALDGDHVGLVLERDRREGTAARHKKVYAFDLRQAGPGGVLAKQELADLLDIDDPHDLDGDHDHKFRYPHLTPECLTVLDDHRLLVVSDNNFPFGRARDPDRPDGTEFIVLRTER